MADHTSQANSVNGSRGDMDISNSAVIEEYKRDKLQLLRDGDIEEYGGRMKRAVKAKYKYKTQILMDLIISEAKIDDFDNVYTKILKDAALFNQYGRNDAVVVVVERLIKQKKYSKILCKPVDDDTTQTILHIAVARQNTEGTRQILDDMKEAIKVEGEQDAMQELLCARAMPTSMSPEKDKWDDTCYESEIPLSMAAWNCDIATLEVLIEEGADLTTKNSKKENVLHSLVEMASKEDCKNDHERVNKLNEVFETLMGHREWEQGKKERQMVLHRLMMAKNEDGFTAITLAAKRSCQVMFDLLIKEPGICKMLHTVEELTNTYDYDITEIDSAYSHCNGTSVLEIIMANSHEQPKEYVQFTEKCPVLDIIRTKWLTYRTWYIVWGCLHLLMMITFTFISVYGMHGGFLQQPLTTEIIFAAVFDAGFSVYAGAMLVIEFAQFIFRRPTLDQLNNPVGDMYYRILLFLFGLSAVSSFIISYTSQDYGGAVLQSTTLIFGWTFLMFFTRAIKIFSFFTVIIQAALVDIARFFSIYLLVLIPFSAAMTIVFRTSDSTTVAEFSSFWSSSLSMFQLTLGLLELDVAQGNSYPEWALVLYISFLAMAYILLLNMIIALLSETCSRVSTNRESQWHLQKLGIILYIEFRLLDKHRKVCGRKKKVTLPRQESQDRLYLEIKSLITSLAVIEDDEIDQHKEIIEDPMGGDKSPQLQATIRPDDLPEPSCV